MKRFNIKTNTCSDAVTSLKFSGSSFSLNAGNGYHFSSGKPKIMTEWGFEKSETPLLKIVQTKENEEQNDYLRSVGRYTTTVD